MPAPTLVSSTPATGTTNVARNASLSVVFSTALASATVTPRTVILKYTALPAERVPIAVSLSSDGLTVTVVPSELLIPNGAYQLTLVGQDVSTSVRITSSDSSALAVTQRISFQTGNSLQADTSSGLKTDEDRDLEGDAVLPDDIGFRATAGAPLRLLRASPGHHSFGIPVTTSRIRLQFSRAVDPASLTGNLDVVFSTFYDQDPYRATYVDLGTGDGPQYYFQFETGCYTGGTSGYLNPDLFEDPTYTLSTTGTYLDINLTPVTGDLPHNLSIFVDLSDQIYDIDGNLMSTSLTYMASTKPFPNWSTVGMIRHEVGAYASNDTPDDFIGLRIWQASIDLWEQLLRSFNVENPSQFHKMYVRVRAAIDTFDDLMALKYINAGVVKELGDLRIQYNTGAGGARPRKVKELEERLAKLYLNVFGGWTQTPRTGIRGEWDILEPGRGYFRDRLWRAELMQNKHESGLTGKLAANTAFTRMQNNSGGPGQWYVWYQ